MACLGLMFRKIWKMAGTDVWWARLQTGSERVPAWLN